MSERYTCLLFRNPQTSFFLKRVLRSLIIIVSLMMPIFGKGVVSLSFLDTVTVSDTAIYLTDICEIKSDLKEIDVLLNSVTIGRSAPPGFVRLVNSQDLVMYKLQSLFQNYDLKPIKNTRSVVKTLAEIKKVGDYASIIEAHIQSNIRWKESDWSYSIVNQEDTWNNYCAPSTITCDGIIAPYAKGAVRLFLLVEQYGQVRRIPVVCKIKVVTPVVITKKSILRNSVVFPELCELHKTDITDLGIVPYLEIADVVGLKASRSISEGTILNRRMVSAIPVIAKGDPITIEVKKGQVVVTICATSRENGGIGDNIWVENAQSHKLIYTRVISKGKVSAL